MEECIFCRIVAGEIPAAKVYEDDEVVAFDDLSPQAPVHTLVIPKRHYSDMGDDVPEEVMGSVFGAVPEIARIKGIDVTGYRVIVNSGKDANQTVGHLHIHVMGGRHMSHGMVVFDAD